MLKKYSLGILDLPESLFSDSASIPPPSVVKQQQNYAYVYLAVNSSKERGIFIWSATVQKKRKTNANAKTTYSDTSETSDTESYTSETEEELPEETIKKPPILLTLSHPNGKHKVDLTISRVLDNSKLTLKTNMNEITELIKKSGAKEYISALYDFAKVSGCCQIELPKQVLKFVPR